jgi:hypothetical protein
MNEEKGDWEMGRQEELAGMPEIPAVIQISGNDELELIGLEENLGRSAKPGDRFTCTIEGMVTKAGEMKRAEEAARRFLSVRILKLSRARLGPGPE